MKKKILLLSFLFLSTLFFAETYEKHDLVLSDDGEIIGSTTTFYIDKFYIKIEELIENDKVKLITNSSSNANASYTYVMPKELLNILAPKLTVMLAMPQYEIHIPMCLQQLYIDYGYFLNINSYKLDSDPSYLIKINYDTKLYNEFLSLYNECKDYKKSYNTVILNNKNRVRNNFRILFYCFFEDKETLDNLFYTFFDEYTNN